MKTERVYSKNATFQKFEVLKTNRNKRYKYQEFLVEGVRNINQAIANDWEIKSFIYSAGKPFSAWAENLLATIPTEINYELYYNLMDDLSDKNEPSELLAIVKMKDEKREFDLCPNPVIVLFDRPSNKGNLGTLLRSCDAFGVDGLIITGHSVDIYDPEVISASMGSFFKVPFMRLYQNTDVDAYLGALKEKYPRLLVVGTTAHNEAKIYDIDLTVPIVLLIGNETEGLSNYCYQMADVLATIPMSEGSGASSFNVSCAATVMLYEAIRQRSS